MRLYPRAPSEYAEAIRSLLPPGAAWDWPAGGLGASMLLGTAQELARVEEATPAVLDTAVSTHRPNAGSWHINEYRRVAAEAIAGTVEQLPRRAFTVGSTVGRRLWSNAAPATSFPVDLVRVDHLLRPFRVGSRVGESLWATDKRYVLRVRYYRSVVDPAPLFATLDAFKQAHVYLSFEDITGMGGSYAPN